MAALSRAKRLPRLKSLLRTTGERERQTPEQQESILRDWAESAGLKIERHEHPVM